MILSFSALLDSPDFLVMPTSIIIGIQILENQLKEYLVGDRVPS
jgi:hypothetical protein